MYLRLYAIRRGDVECIVTFAVVLRQLPFPSLKSRFGNLLVTLRKTTINFSQNNDLSNQQDATIFVYWSFYWSIWICSTCFRQQTRPSSGALLAVYTALLQCTGRQQYRCIVSNCIYSQKCSWRWASLSPETCRADSNRPIKMSINENVCIMLVAYIAVLMIHGLTNVTFSQDMAGFEHRSYDCEAGLLPTCRGRCSEFPAVKNIWHTSNPRLFMRRISDS